MSTRMKVSSVCGTGSGESILRADAVDYVAKGGSSAI